MDEEKCFVYDRDYGDSERLLPKARTRDAYAGSEGELTCERVVMKQDTTQ